MGLECSSSGWVSLPLSLSRSLSLSLSLIHTHQPHQHTSTQGTEPYYDRYDSDNDRSELDLADTNDSSDSAGPDDDWSDADAAWWDADDDWGDDGGGDDASGSPGDGFEGTNGSDGAGTGSIAEGSEGDDDDGPNGSYGAGTGSIAEGSEGDGSDGDDDNGDGDDSGDGDASGMHKIMLSILSLLALMSAVVASFFAISISGRAPTPAPEDVKEKMLTYDAFVPVRGKRKQWQLRKKMQKIMLAKHESLPIMELEKYVSEKQKRLVISAYFFDSSYYDDHGRPCSWASILSLLALMSAFVASSFFSAISIFGRAPTPAPAKKEEMLKKMLETMLETMFQKQKRLKILEIKKERAKKEVEKKKVLKKKKKEGEFARARERAMARLLPNPVSKSNERSRRRLRWFLRKKKN